MALVSSLVGRLETPVEGGKSIGTVYPVAEGYILTAYHVFPNINDFSKSKVFWQRNDKARQGELLGEGMAVSELVYTNKDFDIVIAKCATPENLSSVIWHTGKISGEWESIGFAKSGQDQALKTRLKDPVNGSFLTEQDDDWIQHLEAKADATTVELWRGMSGAPVFIKDTDYLAAIIIETPRKYWIDEKNAIPVHKERLYALSIPYVHKNCVDFRAALLRIRCDVKEHQYYYSLAQPLLEKTEVFIQLQQACPEAQHNTQQLFDYLVSLPVSDFLEKLVFCQQKGACTRALGELAEVVLPMFVDKTLVNKVRHQADAQIIVVPYSRKSVIESLMARTDQLPMEFLGVSEDGEFIATHALPAAPECAEDDDLRVKSMGQHLSNKFGADIARLAGHTRYLLKGAHIGDIARPLTGEEAVQAAQDQLDYDREDGKRRYYLILTDADKDSSYYQSLKKLFPQCAIIIPQGDGQQLRQERREYRKINDIFSPYLNQKRSKDKA